MCSSNANLLWFVPTTVVSFAIWYLGENLLFSRTFSYFHGPTGYVELMPVTAAAYFLQVLNMLAAGSAFVLFLHRRKRATWLGASFTLVFLGFIDGLVLSSLVVVSGLFIPHSPLRTMVPFAGSVLAALVLIAAWWMWRTPRLRIERWLNARPSLVSFRTANLHIYAVLILIRLAIFVPQGFIYYFSMRAFHLHMPLTTVLAVTPAVLAVGGMPIAPVGLGLLQAVAVEELRPYAAPTKILAVFLALSAAMLLYRVLVGLGAAGVYTTEVMSNEICVPRCEARRLGNFLTRDRSTN